MATEGCPACPRRQWDSYLRGSGALALVYIHGLIVRFSCLFQNDLSKAHNHDIEIKIISIGSLPAINPIKTTTVAAEVFCSTECTDFPGCNSFTYLTEANTDNCQLSSSVDGASSSAVSVVYKKVPEKTATVSGTVCIIHIMRGVVATDMQNLIVITGYHHWC